MTAPTQCDNCLGPAAPWRQRIGTGIRVVMWCSTCRAPAHGGRSYKPRSSYADEALRRMPELPPAGSGEPCQVCGADNVPLERHHLAPRHLFGDECERWPTVDVCRPCHERWHRLVDGSIDRWKRARDAMRAKRGAEIAQGMAARSTFPWAQKERAENERALAERKANGSRK